MRPQESLVLYKSFNTLLCTLTLMKHGSWLATCNAEFLKRLFKIYCLFEILESKNSPIQYSGKSGLRPLSARAEQKMPVSIFMKMRNLAIKGIQHFRENEKTYSPTKIAIFHILSLCSRKCMYAIFFI
jgi:hypothetical protein